MSEAAGTVQRELQELPTGTWGQGPPGLSPGNQGLSPLWSVLGNRD